MRIPLRYSFRNLLVRKVSSGLTVAGIALVVVMVVITLSLLNGLETTTKSSASPDNVIILSSEASTESGSRIPKDKVSLIKIRSGIRLSSEGIPLISEEMLDSAPLKTGAKRKINDTLSIDANRRISMRGVEKIATQVHERFHIVEGRFFNPRAGEVVVGVNLTKDLSVLKVGGKIKLADRDWTVVGTFAADKTAFESEVWLDLGELMELRGQAEIGSIALKVQDPAQMEAFCKPLVGDDRLGIKAMAETQYYVEQNKMADGMKWFGYFIGAVMAMCAVFGAMNTLYSSLSERIREVGTLRAMGFPRRSVMLAFMLESLLLALGGGIIGGLVASLTNGYSMTMMDSSRFATLAFEFRVTPEIVAIGIGFALVMGLLGGLLPSWRASRIPVIQAMREL